MTTPFTKRPFTKRFRHGWALETVGMVAVFLVYDWLRDRVTGNAAAALRNARDIVDAERFLGIYHERSIQEAFVRVDWFMSFWNIWYGTIHFVLPVVAFVWLYRKVPTRYVRWRNTFVLMIFIGLIGFWCYPLMPPRLMPSSFGFIDAAADYFNFGPQVKITLGPDGRPSAQAVREFGNLFAAMPSLHVGWSTWVACALFPVVRRPWAKALLVLYPTSVIFGIVVTGNHWFLDAVGGWVVLGLGWLGARAIEWGWDRRHASGRPAAVS